VNSSVYRRDKDGRIFGTDESKLNPAPNQQISASVDQPKTANNPAPSYPQKIQQPKPQINLGQIKLPEQIKKFFSSDKNKAKTPIGRVTFYAKRIVIVYLIFFMFLGIKTSLSLQKMPASSAVAVEDTAGTNWLLVGSDSREGLTLEEQQQLHTGQDEGAQRTDTIMLVHISNSGTTLVSLPRDSYVYIPEHTDLEGNLQEQRRNKLNAAYSQGGPPLLVETVEFNTGLKIDHYMEIGFKGIRDLTDAVGGVDICVPQDYNDEKSNLNVKAGCQELDGVTALAYVRMRYADPKGDIGRIERQQQY
jgi:LCP family protein required for cell wall assembly